MQAAAQKFISLNPKTALRRSSVRSMMLLHAHGKGGYYLFDSLSDLAADWYSDRMLGNFFMLTCPYLYQMETIAFFAILRNQHSFHAISTIIETTQLFLDVYHHNGKNYVHPIKVQGRYSPTMNMLHVWQEATMLCAGYRKHHHNRDTCRKAVVAAGFGKPDE